MSARDVELRTAAPARQLARASAKAAAARAELDAAIVVARAAGMPLRRVAELTGLSPEWVRRIAAGTARRSAVPDRN